MNPARNGGISSPSDPIVTAWAKLDRRSSTRLVACDPRGEWRAASVGPRRRRRIWQPTERE